MTCTAIKNRFVAGLASMLKFVLTIILRDHWQTACSMTKAYHLSQPFLIRCYLMKIFHAFDECFPVPFQLECSLLKKKKKIDCLFCFLPANIWSQHQLNLNHFWWSKCFSYYFLSSLYLILILHFVHKMKLLYYCILLFYNNLYIKW